MNNFHIYIELGSRKAVGRKIWDLLSDIFSKGTDSTFSVTWVYRDKKLSARTMLSIIWGERRICKDRDVSIKNTVIFNELRHITRSATRMLRDFAFKVCFQQDVDFGLKNKLDKQNVDVAVYSQDQGCDCSQFNEWLQSPASERIYPFVDYVRIALNLSPNTCRYQSCLGKTIYITAGGDFLSCPFASNAIPLNNIKECRELDDVFDTAEYTEMLLKAINKREHCNQHCKHFSQCLGGCPLEDTLCSEKKMLSCVESFPLDLQNTSPALLREYCESLAMRFRV